MYFSVLIIVNVWSEELHFDWINILNTLIRKIAIN